MDLMPGNVIMMRMENSYMLLAMSLAEYSNKVRITISPSKYLQTAHTKKAFRKQFKGMLPKLSTG